MNRAELESKVKALGLELLQAKERLAAMPKKWEPKGGKWFVTLGGSVSSIGEPHSGVSSFGSEYSTQEQAEKAAKAMRAHNRLLAYVAEFAPDWEVDWSNPEQAKYLVYFDNHKGSYGYARAFSDHSLGAVYMPQEVAVKLAAKLNRGEVEL